MSSVKETFFVVVFKLIFLFTGGYYDKYFDEILRYDSKTDTWTLVGQLTEGKEFFAVTPFKDVSHFNAVCP